MKKCGGLPLALKTLGRMLRSKTSDAEWEEVLNSEIWNLRDESNIMPALRLSYYDLPPQLKQMFVYCCLFPKHYEFEKDELVLLWMAEGFLYGSNGNISMEDLGRECFKELESRSFFQHSTWSKSRYIMHDLVNDLAMSVAGDFFFKLGDNMDVEDKNKALEMLRHFSFVSQVCGLYKTFKALQRARRLRTFLAMSESWNKCYLSDKVLVEVLPHMMSLRVLSLANYAITIVPHCIGSLKHLRYLNFSNTDIICLPEQVGDLYNLQSLLLSGCTELSSLPNSLMKLINLRHIDITDTPELKELPIGIGGLTGLQTLSKVIIGNANGFKLSHFKDLQHLQGRLTIEGLDEVTNSTHAKEAGLQQKKGLCDLEMKWSDVFDNSRNELSEYEVLKGLKPFEKLTNFKIWNYMGKTFPSWLGDPIYDCLTQITLRGCRSCTCLPTLGHLPSLQKLFVESMNGLKRVGSELLGTRNGNAFPSLEILEFKDMEGWEEWSTINDVGENGIATSFPCLREISIRNCPKLDVVVIYPLIPSLKVLQVDRCSIAVLRQMIGVSSSINRFIMVGINGLTELRREILEPLRTVEYLSISGCDELKYLWESEAEACKILVNLQELEVSECKNLVRLGKKKVDLAKVSMKSLRKVEIADCERLESYDCGSDCIEKLEISSCGSVTSLAFSAIEVNWLLNNFLSSLTSLRLDEIPNVRMLPEGCLVHLKELSIYGCENIERIPEKGYGFLPHLCLISLSIENCKNLKSFPHEQLQSLTSLEDMSTSDCPSLHESFPCGLWPPNLRKLNVGGLKKAVSEWGMQNFPNSLVELTLQDGYSAFANVEDISSSRNNNSSTSLLSSCSFLLPSSLTFLCLSDFMELETISKGMEHLTSLETLFIYNCQKLKDLPETLLPSLSRLHVYFPSSKLRKKCKRKGKYWPFISQIPYVSIKE